MKIEMKLIASAALLTTLISAPAVTAKDGLYISGAINSTTQESFSSRSTGSNAPNTGAAGGPSGTVVDKDTGVGFVGGIGYKKQLTEDFFASVEAFYSAEDADTTTLNNVRVNHVELNATYGADLRFGTNVTDKVSIYGLAGITAHDFDSSISYTFAPPKDNVSDEEWGFTYGGGVEIALTDRLSTFGEFRLVNDLDFDTPVDRGGVSNTEELDYTTIRTGLRFSF